MSSLKDVLAAANALTILTKYKEEGGDGQDRPTAGAADQRSVPRRQLHPTMAGAACRLPRRVESSSDGSIRKDSNSSLPVRKRIIASATLPSSTTSSSVKRSDRSAGRDEPDSKSFPEKLREMLSQDSSSDVITWLPDGRSFVVLNPTKLQDEVLPQFGFRKTKFDSFVRKLYRWGFRQANRHPGQMIFCHQCFRRQHHPTRRGASSSVQSSNQEALEKNVQLPLGGTMKAWNCKSLKGKVCLAEEGVQKTPVGSSTSSPPPSSSSLACSPKKQFLLNGKSASRIKEGGISSNMIDRFQKLKRGVDDGRLTLQSQQQPIDGKFVPPSLSKYTMSTGTVRTGDLLSLHKQALNILAATKSSPTLTPSPTGSPKIAAVAIDSFQHHHHQQQLDIEATKRNLQLQHTLSRLRMRSSINTLKQSLLLDMPQTQPAYAQDTIRAALNVLHKSS